MTEHKDSKLRVHGPSKSLLLLDVNGTTHELFVEPRRTLLDALRVNLGLTGTKQACGQGNCGACTVHLDGQAVCSCLLLAVECARPRDRHDRGTTPGGRAAPATAGFCRARCAPVRLLHIRPDYGRRGAAGTYATPHRGRSARGHGRQPVPLRRLLRDRARGAGGLRAGIRSGLNSFAVQTNDEGPRTKTAPASLHRSSFVLRQVAR